MSQARRQLVIEMMRVSCVRTPESAQEYMRLLKLWHGLRGCDDTLRSAKQI